ncbi:hypothetical protein [Desulfovibrio ferrophilus]|uniref:Uncharacterized protein n=1 Tax=Desulfovibrio ferrophilus TaxID=241368 RepID=A0A2Z6AUC0_9BACT|nr:hypothetical protein [Desulfovibrio ferrophilus]BBD06823.1 uncharacterized protein DFE_0097 [Desulfovibrio ferrophilus]
MHDLDQFTETITICDEECPYDPKRKIALVMCENCSNQEEVDVVSVENGKGTVYGFMCSQCGHFNQPCE